MLISLQKERRKSPMTDSQKLDLILSELTDMKGEINGFKTEVFGEINGLKDETARMNGEINGFKDEMARMNGEINGLKNGQYSIRKDLRNISNRLEDTYQLALEAWGNTIENRELLTQ